jgi:hypothetical protein
MRRVQRWRLDIAASKPGPIADDPYFASLRDRIRSDA